jgi:WD40 repeat protein
MLLIRIILLTTFILPIQIFGQKNDDDNSKIPLNLKKINNGITTINSISISPDEKTLVSANSDGEVIFWDLIGGDVIKKLACSPLSINYVSFCNGGKYVLMSGDDGIIRMLDVKTMKLPYWFDTHKTPIKCMAISQNGRYVGCSFDDDTIMVLGLFPFKISSRLKTSKSNINSLTFKPKSLNLISICDTGIIEEWDITQRKPSQRLHLYSQPTPTVILSEGNFIVTDSNIPDKKITVYNINDKSQMTLNSNICNINLLSVNYDQNCIAIAGDEPVIEIWNLKQKENSIKLAEAINIISDISFFPNVKLVAACSWDNSIKVWDYSNGKLLRCFSEQEDQRINTRYTLNCTEKVLANDNKPIQFSKKDSKIKIVWENKIDKVCDSTLRIKFSCTSPNKISNFFFFINGKPLEINKFNSTADFVFDTIIPVLHGENTITALAIDGKRNKENYYAAFNNDFNKKGVGIIESTTKDNPGQLMTQYNNRYAIVIGISKYKFVSTLKNEGEQPLISNLMFADSDAIAFTNFLKDSSLSGGYWNVQLFLNDSATENNVSSKLFSTLSYAKPDDEIFIFFSGHGTGQPKTPSIPILLLYDTDLAKYPTGLRIGDILQAMAGSECSHIIAFFDACKSGDVKGIKGNLKSINWQKYKQQENEFPQNCILFSSTNAVNEYSNEDKKLKSGVFTYFLLKGLMGHAEESKQNPQNPDYVDLIELVNYVTISVADYTSKNNMYPQVPTIIKASEKPISLNYPLAKRKKQWIIKNEKK